MVQTLGSGAESQILHHHPCLFTSSGPETDTLHGLRSKASATRHERSASPQRNSAELHTDVEPDYTQRPTNAAEAQTAIDIIPVA